MGVTHTLVYLILHRFCRSSMAAPTSEGSEAPKPTTEDETLGGELGRYTAYAARVGRMFAKVSPYSWPSASPDPQGAVPLDPAFP